MENKEIEVLDHGFVKLVDTMGTDQDIEDAARVSYGKGTRKLNETKGLLRYLIRHNHTSPLEMAEVKFHLKLPIFVMRQLVRHRTASLNECSARYSEMSSEFYVPEKEDMGTQSSSNKQGTEVGNLDEKAGLIQFEMNRAHDTTWHSYQNISNNGLSREQARTVLTVANYTECFWKCDLRNFLNFCMLRRKSNAQMEIRVYADAMYNMVKDTFPIICEAWEDYVYNAVSFSPQEMRIIKDNLNGSWVMSKYGLTSREATEFLEKLK